MTTPLAGDAAPLHDTVRSEARGHRMVTDPDTDRLWKEIFERVHAVAAAAPTPTPEPDEPPGMHPDGDASVAGTESVAPRWHASNDAPSVDGLHPGKRAAEAESRVLVEALRDAIGSRPASPKLARAQIADAPIHAAREGARVHGEKTLPTVAQRMPSPSPAASVALAPRPAVVSAVSVTPTGTLAASRRADAASSEPASQGAVQRFAAPKPLVDEAVQVYHRDGVVAITIRDLALQPANALRCAFEAARQLAGDSRALKQVTLNGKSIYEGRAAADPAKGASPHPRVSFTC